MTQMELISANGWQCNSERAKNNSIGLGIFVLIFTIIGVVAIRQSFPGDEDYFLGWFCVLISPAVIVLMMCTRIGRGYCNCYWAAKRIGIYPDYLLVEGVHIPARLIQRIEYIGPWRGRGDFSEFLVGFNGAFRIVLRRASPKFGRAVHFLVRFTGERDRRIAREFVHLVSQTMNLNENNKGFDKRRL